MSPITLQAFFHLYYDLMFTVIFLRLLQRYRQTNDPLLKRFVWVFFCGTLWINTLAIPFLLIPLISPLNLVVYKIVGVVVWIPSYLSIASALVTLGYIYPKFPTKVSLLSIIFVWVAMTVVAALPFRPAVINNAGIIDFNYNPFVMPINSGLLGISFITMGVTFIIKTIKNNLLLQGVLIGIGLGLASLFLPLTYQSNTFDIFVFTSTFGAIGLTLIALGITLHPLLRKP